MYKIIQTTQIHKIAHPITATTIILYRVKMINFAYRETLPLRTMCAERHDLNLTYTLTEKGKNINDNCKYSTNKKVKPNNLMLKKNQKKSGDRDDTQIKVGFFITVIINNANSPCAWGESMSQGDGDLFARGDGSGARFSRAGTVALIGRIKSKNASLAPSVM